MANVSKPDNVQLFESLSLSKFFINLTINAVMNAKIVYTIVAIKNVASNTANVTIKYIANATAATAIGQLINFSNTAAKIIVAIGRAKKINKIFICYHIPSRGLCILIYYMNILLICDLLTFIISIQNKCSTLE